MSCSILRSAGEERTWGSWDRSRRKLRMWSCSASCAPPKVKPGSTPSRFVLFAVEPAKTRLQMRHIVYDGRRVEVEIVALVLPRQNGLMGATNPLPLGEPHLTLLSP